MLGKARLAQSVERLTLNQVVVGSSPTVGVPSFIFTKFIYIFISINYFILRRKYIIINLMSSSVFKALNLRGADTLTLKDSLQIRESARQKNKSQMWDRLTFNFLKKFTPMIPNSKNTHHFKQRFHGIISDEVSRFLDAPSSQTLTDKSLRELELKL